MLLQLLSYLVKFIKFGLLNFFVGDRIILKDFGKCKVKMIERKITFLFDFTVKNVIPLPYKEAIPIRITNPRMVANILSSGVIRAAK